ALLPCSRLIRADSSRSITRASLSGVEVLSTSVCEHRSTTCREANAERKAGKSCPKAGGWESVEERCCSTSGQTSTSAAESEWERAPGSTDRLNSPSGSTSFRELRPVYASVGR